MEVIEAMTRPTTDGQPSLPKRSGPRTEAGKEVARWNSTRHGIRSQAPVVPGLEKPEDWQEHRAGVLESLAPIGHLEGVLTDRVALLSWRLHRVTRYETEAIALSREKIEEDVHTMSRLLRSPGESPYASTHPEDIRYEAKHNRKAHNALKRFPSLGADKTLKGEDASSVVWGVLMAARRNQASIEGGEEIDAETLEGLPEGSDIYELPSMNAGDVRACVEEIALRAGVDADELLEAATDEARWDAAKAAGRKERTEEEVSRLQRERILPAEDTLQKVARYEAHLWRQLAQALHELEALQARRSGRPAPLARLDVQGIPES
jgi:hypothetical protein